MAYTPFIPPPGVTPLPIEICVDIVNMMLEVLSPLPLEDINFVLGTLALYGDLRVAVALSERGETP